MTLYRRGSVTVEAIKASDVIKGGDLPDWVTVAINAGRLVPDENSVDVQTTEGWSIANPKGDRMSPGSDWIVQRQTEYGELYPIPNARFTDPKAGYTRVE